MSEFYKWNCDSFIFFALKINNYNEYIQIITMIY